MLEQFSPFFAYTLSKKVIVFPVPYRDVTNQLSLAGNNLKILGQEELVRDILAGDGKTITFFYSVLHFVTPHWNCTMQ
jgi:hypothetical protein